MRDWLVNLPDELTESDLTDMVEGTLPEAREPVAIAALKAEPRLGLLIKQMRADKAALASIDPGAAPDSLADSVLAEIDSRVLRAMADEARELPVSIPIHTAFIDEASPARAVVESGLFRVCAAAAAVVLVGLVTAYVIREYHAAKRPTSSRFVADGGAGPGGLMAGADNNDALQTAEPPAQSPSTSLSMQAGAEIQRGSGAAKREEQQGTASSALAMGAGQSPGTEPAAAIGPPEAPLSKPAAARLAREGRLALVVRPIEGASVLKRLDSLARIGVQAPTSSHRELNWKAIDLGQPPEQFASLLIPPAPAPSRASPAPEPPALAGTRPSGAGVDGASVASPSLPTLRLVVKGLYTVQLEPSERGLTEAERAIGEPLQSIMYRRLDTPIVEELSFEPESIVWWTGSPSRWSKGAIVPIIVEGLE